ncbi:unnamed protein product [Vitrella brassicaformis CCMP3155]|uniref:2-dehydropantoate 2-reductase n=2 Tax=Vitrella brassicaformis TaxID=1169539 RepID=A0A0G4ERB4_VITBC|nr:unnamed protein product [Vitrella brassicaformis CCMP3155]|eukprot:CEL99821.1 unnamed protein product [Vitrella brassicaformis CCMP3155]
MASAHRPQHPAIAVKIPLPSAHSSPSLPSSTTASPSPSMHTSFVPGSSVRGPLAKDCIRVGVVGGGSVGLVFAAYLNDHPNVKMTILSRREKVQQLKEYGGEVACDGRVWQLGGACEDNSKTHPLTIMPLDDPNIGADGPQDLLLICVKAQYVRECLHHLEEVIGPDTVVVAAQNGIPFWLMHRGGDFLDGRIDEVPACDPDGRISAVLLPHVLGAVLQMAVAIDEPQHTNTDTHTHMDHQQTTAGCPDPERVRVHGTTYKIVLGEPDNTMSERLMSVGSLMQSVGLPVELTTRLRVSVWKKVLANVTMNPITSLTQRTIPDLCAENETRTIIQDIMHEVACVCNKNGTDLGRDPVGDTMKLLANCYPNHKPSMRQDLDTGKRLEVDPIVTAVVQIAQCLQVPTPKLNFLHALISSRDRAIALQHSPICTNTNRQPSPAPTISEGEGGGDSPAAGLCRGQSESGKTAASTSSGEADNGKEELEMDIANVTSSVSSIDLGTSHHVYPDYFSASPLPSRSVSPRMSEEDSDSPRGWEDEGGGGDGDGGRHELTMSVLVD